MHLNKIDDSNSDTNVENEAPTTNEYAKASSSTGASCADQTTQSTNNTPSNHSKSDANECCVPCPCTSLTGVTQQWHYQALFKMAVTGGDLQQTRYLVREGLVDLDVQFQPHQQTAAHLAVQANNISVLRELVSLGVNVNGIDIYGGSALHLACTLHMAHRLQLVQTLLAARANTNLKDKVHGSTALHLASAHQHLDVVRALLEAGADIHSVNNDLKTALHLAAQLVQRLSVLWYLWPKNYSSLLHLKCGWLAGARLLILAGADCNSRDRHGLSAMFCACMAVRDIKDRHELLLCMLTVGADLTLEYWATATNPYIILPVSESTLQWLDVMRSGWHPANLVQQTIWAIRKQHATPNLLTANNRQALEYKMHILPSNIRNQFEILMP